MIITCESAYMAYTAINESKLKELRTSLYKAAIRYAEIRAGWYFLDVNEKLEQDGERTVAHNRFIDACNIMSRNMRNANEDVSWATILGKDRKYIGDFACYIHAFLGIQNR